MAKKQPWGITLAAVLLAIGGALTLLSALFMIFMGSALSTVGTTIPATSLITGTMLFMGFIYILLGAAYLATAYFLYFKHRTWAWWIAIILSVIGIVFGLSSVLAFSIIGISMFALNIVVIIGLLDKKAKKACKIKFG